jgi:hypothetical protein
MGFSSCSEDDEDDLGGNGKNLLIGKWKQSSTVYWTFDERYVLVDDEEDVFHGQQTPYTYDDQTKKLVLGGFATFNVVELTSTTLKLTGWENLTFTRVE